MAQVGIYEEAIKEAYASAAKGEAILHTLEFDHPSFPRDELIRVACYPLEGPEPKIFQCLLEDDSPVDGGTVRDFVGFPFELTLPDFSRENMGYFEIKIGINDTVDKFFEAAVSTRGIITAHYREYIQGRELEGPYATWPGIEIIEPRREGGMLYANGKPVPFLDYGFGRIYTLAAFPALS